MKTCSVIGIVVGVFLLLICIILYIVLRYIHLPLKKDTFTRMSSKDIEKKSKETQNKIVVSFSTIPSRVEFIPNVVKEINKQSLKPDVIYACVPYYSKRLEKEYELPDFEYMGDNVRIIRCEDFGPATKLLGCVPYEDDPDTIIITIDDDQTYHKDVFKTLTGYGEEYPDSVFSFHAFSKELTPARCPIFKNIKSPKSFYIEGFGGVLYRRRFISPEMYSYFQHNLSRDCFVSDDLVISTWLEIEGIPRKKLCDILNVRGTKSEIDKNDALNKADREGVYSRCHKEMIELEKKLRKNIITKEK